MLDVSSAGVERAIVHRVGNRMRDEGISLSPGEAPRSSSLNDLLLRYFLAPTSRKGEQYELFHESDLALNEISHYSELIFKSPGEFVEHTAAIARHLYRASSHPNIGGGEFIVILFNGILRGGSPSPAIGMFRVESKHEYLDVATSAQSWELLARSGISLDSIQKGALLFPGSSVYVIDALGQKTKYWVEDFLKAVPARTEKRCGQAAGSLIKSVSSLIESPSDALEFGRRLEEQLSGTDALTVDNLLELSSEFVDDRRVDALITAVETKYGVSLEKNALIESRHLAKVAKDVNTKAKIAEGVSLLVTRPDVKINSITVRSTKAGLRAIVDLDVMGE